LPTRRQQTALAAQTPRDRRSPRALDLRTFTPAVITLLAQKISATASALYRPRFGVGITDWRIMALLAAEPWIAPVDIAEATGLDKAAVSRSLRDLRDAGLIEFSGEPSQRRRRPIALTPKGLGVHDQIVEVALARQTRLLADFAPAERAALTDYLGRMLRAVGGSPREESRTVNPGLTREI
jgi:DNA-binding MarR family transcriptional regulator